MKNPQEIFEDFIENKLLIKEYELRFFSNWKDNITWLIKYEKTIIIQLLVNISKGQKKIISKMIDICNKNWFIVANNVFKNRFINHKWNTFQVMQNLNWVNKTYDEINLEIRKDVVRYIANFHNKMEKYDFSKFKWTTNKYKNLYYFIWLAYEQVKINNSHEDKFNQLLWLSLGIKISNKLRKWCIHWDFSLKNVLFDWNKISWIIDYEMVSYDDFLWDLVDHFRNYLKYDKFGKQEFFELLQSYEEVRALNKDEKNSLKNYLKLIILNTWFRYFLSIFEWSWFNNYTQNMWTSYDKVDRCIWELKKVDLFFS